MVLMLASPLPAPGMSLKKADKIEMSTILIIEDDMDVRDMIQNLLERHGHEVLLAEDGVQGMEAFAASEPDMVITDLYMPHMKGDEAIRQIRQVNADIKILAISGGGDCSPDTQLKKARGIGATETLKKPFIPADFLSAVNRLVGIGA